MDNLHAIYLGIIQGLTEFLPISSSGHLVIFQKILGFNEPEVLFDTALHFGTLIAIIIVFRKEVLQLLSAFFKYFSAEKIINIRSDYENDETSRLLLLIIIGTIPTVIIGLVFKDFIESLFSSITVTGVMLVITSSFLWCTKYFKNTKKTILEMTILNALIIGIVQGFAIAPGISRSGITIAFALFLGIERGASGRYSFLLSLPAVLGATILNFSTCSFTLADLPPIVIGTLFSLIAGYFSLVILLKLIQKGKFYIFSPYCLVLGAITIFVSITY